MLKNMFIPTYRTFTSTVDAGEVKLFKNLASTWWDELGPMKPLHSMNKIRIPFIRDGLINTGRTKVENIKTATPLKGVPILDVGCGGGILTEPLAKLGAEVTGIDAASHLIDMAKCHAKTKNLNINYAFSSVESHCKENYEKYDAVVASEIIEHVTEKDEFIRACVACLKPNGSIFITTFNKTVLANFFGIIMVEDVFKTIPKSTHSYDKFIAIHRLQKMLEEHGCRTYLTHGTFYNLFNNKWYWCPNDSLHFALQAVKITSKEENVNCNTK